MVEIGYWQLKGGNPFAKRIFRSKEGLEEGNYVDEIAKTEEDFQKISMWRAT